jgi:chromosome segregation ATPase
MPEMSLDGLPGQFEQFVERARTALGREITAAKNAVTALNVEKTSVQNALTDLQNQHKSTQGQLQLMTNDLQRLSDLVGVGHDIEKARKELAALNVEKGKVTTALEKLAKEKTEREAQLVTLGNEANRMIAIRSEGEAVMADLRKRLGAVQMGQRT